MSILRAMHDRESQHGFTLVELLVALTISALIMVGTSALLSYIVVGAAQNGDRAQAQLEAYYVSFWIGDDIVQAQTISLDYSENGNLTGHFPLVISWQGQDGNHTVTYRLEAMTNSDENHGNLTLIRENKVEGAVLGNVTVSKYLLPGTSCDRKYKDGESLDVLVVKAASKVESFGGNMTYEISPRSSNVVWKFGE